MFTVTHASQRINQSENRIDLKDVALVVEALTRLLRLQNVLTQIYRVCRVGWNRSAYLHPGFTTAKQLTNIKQIYC